MADPAETLREHLACVVALGRRVPGGLAALHEAEGADLVALVPVVQALANAGQGLLAVVAGEIAARDGGRREPSLAQRLGYRNARALVADQAGVSFGQASALVTAGEVIRRGTDPSGGPVEPELPHVAEALLAGELSLHLALLIDDTVEALRRALPAVELDAVEAVLVEQATSGDLSVTAFTTECKRLIEQADPPGSKDRDDTLKTKASIRQTRLRNGLLRIVAELDPERAAYYLTAIHVKTNPRRPDSDASGDSDDNEDADTAGSSGGASPRSSGPQPDPMVTRLDAFASICKDSLKADDGVQAGVDTTVLVRIDLHDLQTGLGHATIDGIDTPIAAATARRMAVNAEIIPQVLGGASQLLDQGRARRLFTKAQRYAIYAGYDSCAFPGCDLPLSMTEIHHLDRWADRHRHGRGTDLTNGIPLCGFHNRLMDTGWNARHDPDGTPWFHPPATLARTPLRGHRRTPRATRPRAA